MLSDLYWNKEAHTLHTETCFVNPFHMLWAVWFVDASRWKDLEISQLRWKSIEYDRRWQSGMLLTTNVLMYNMFANRAYKMLWEATKLRHSRWWLCSGEGFKKDLPWFLGTSDPQGTWGERRAKRGWGGGPQRTRTNGKEYQEVRRCKRSGWVWSWAAKLLLHTDLIKCLLNSPDALIKSMLYLS